MDSFPAPRTGYTLPVFACAAAIAALQHLKYSTESSRRSPTSKLQGRSVSVDLIKPDQIVDVPIEQVALLGEGGALAIARSDPGDNLDLTRNTPIWAWVQWSHLGQDTPVLIEGGEGIGRDQNSTSPGDTESESKAAIYRYATQLIQTNLQRLLTKNQTIKVTIILPEGRALATRTSNTAFGVVEGLSLLGTSGLSQPLSAPNQLELFRATLQSRIDQHPETQNSLVYCIGENGLDLARRFGIADVHVIKTANWIGPLLVEGAIQGLQSILLLGYHGKLIKLAGGIFHTHHHLADGRLEIFTALCGVLGMATTDLQILWACQTTEAAWQYLTDLDQRTGSQWVDTVYKAIAQRIDQRAQAYIYTHSERQVKVGTVLFGRNRQIICQSDRGRSLGKQLGANFCVIDS